MLSSHRILQLHSSSRVLGSEVWLWCVNAKLASHPQSGARGLALCASHHVERHKPSSAVGHSALKTVLTQLASNSTSWSMSVDTVNCYRSSIDRPRSSRDRAQHSSTQRDTSPIVPLVRPRRCSCACVRREVIFKLWRTLALAELRTRMKHGSRVTACRRATARCNDICRCRLLTSGTV